MARERITIDGMGCQHCVIAVRSALEQLGVNVHDVDIGYAEVSYAPSIDRKQIDAAISEAGYQPCRA